MYVLFTEKKHFLKNLKILRVLPGNFEVQALLQPNGALEMVVNGRKAYIFPIFAFHGGPYFARLGRQKQNSDVYAVTKKTRFSAYFWCSQVHFPCISQRLLTLTNDTHPLFLTQYVQYSFVLNTITFCSPCIVSFVSISYSVFLGQVFL